MYCRTGNDLDACLSVACTWRGPGAPQINFRKKSLVTTWLGFVENQFPVAGN